MYVCMYVCMYVPNVAYAVFHCSKGRGLIVNSIGTKRKIQLSVISVGMHRWKMRSNNIKYRAGLDRKPLHNSFMYFFFRCMSMKNVQTDVNHRPCNHKTI